MKLIALLALPAALGGCLSSAHPAAALSVSVVYMDHEPPQPRAETVTPRRNPDEMWVSGHWSPNRSDYAWTPGHWELPATGKKEWQDGKWEHEEHGWRYTEGSWR